MSSSSAISITKSLSATTSPFFLNKFDSLKSSSNTNTKENSQKLTESKSMLFETVPSEHEAHILSHKNYCIKNALTTVLGNLGANATSNFSQQESFAKKQRNLSFGEIRPFNFPSNTTTIASDSPTLSQTLTSASSAFNSLFIEPQELKRKLLELPKFIVILLDCRTYTDFNVKHIKDSVHLNCRDKLIKKRLLTRKLTVKDLISNEDVKNKLESNEDCLLNNVRAVASAGFASLVNNSAKIINKLSCTQSGLNKTLNSDEEISNLKIHDDFKDNTTLNEANNDKMIVIYDDKTSDLSELQSESNPLKIVQDNIKQSGYKKECKILKGGFKEFAEIFPEYCVNKSVVERKNFQCESEDQQQSEIENAKMTEITPYLYLGNEVDAKNVVQLEKEGVFYILNVTKNIPFYDNLLPATSSNKFNLKRISVNDCSNQNLKQHFDEAIEFIELARVNNSKVLVHCQAGISRSPTIVIAYLMKKLNISMDDAYNRVREKRSIIAPNLIFMSQLMDFEAKYIKINRNTNEILSDESNSSSPESTDGNGFLKFSNAKINASKTNSASEGIKQPIMVCN